MSPPRVVTLDIETAPLESYTWGLWDQNVGLDMVKAEWTILAYAAKWHGTKGVIYNDAGGRGVLKVRDDRHLLRGLWAVLNDADLVVAQNGKKFDIKKINARLVMAGLPPYAPVRVIDTLQAAKTVFGFTSNRLEWMSKHLTNTPKSAHKKFPGFELWRECLADNPAAWAEMKKYNIRDVVATEKVYEKLRPWITNHPNMGAYSPTTAAHSCPKCQSAATQKRGVAVTQHGRYHRFQCNACGGWSRGKEMVVGKAERMKMLVPQ